MKKCPRCGYWTLKLFTNVDPNSDIQIYRCQRCGFKKIDKITKTEALNGV